MKWGALQKFAAQILRNGKFVMHDDWCYYFNYEAFTKLWAQASQGKLKIVSYDKARSGPGVIPAFLKAMHTDTTTVKTAQQTEWLNRRTAHTATLLQKFAGWLIRHRLPSIDIDHAYCASVSITPSKLQSK